MAPNNKKERRGKHQKNQTTTTTGSSSQRKGDTDSALAQQLDQASTTLARTSATMTDLHSQWRVYLRTLSYLVAVLSLHQLQATSLVCILDMKTLRDVASTDSISAVLAATLVLKDSAALVIGVVMAVLLVLYLRLDPRSGTLSHPYFVSAQACALPIFGLQLYYRKFSSNNSCLGDRALSLSIPDIDDRPGRQFPIVLVFNIIMFACVWFMRHQRRQLTASQKSVELLKKELLESKQKGAEVKKKR